MRTYDVPDWITTSLVKHGISENDYLLYGAARALGIVRMAADALDDLDQWTESLGNPLKIAEYHAYAGISASRTAIDAAAAWLNARLQLKVSPRHQINLSRDKFQTRVLRDQPQLKLYVQELCTLGNDIDLHRQQAQHREGSALRYHEDSQESGHPGGWYLAPKGISGDHTADIYMAEVFRSWAYKIETNLHSIHQQLA